jgi:hypothetical protein
MVQERKVVMNDKKLIKGETYVNGFGEIIAVDTVIKLAPMNADKTPAVEETLFVGHTGTIYYADGVTFQIDEILIDKNDRAKDSAHNLIYQVVK